MSEVGIIEQMRLRGVEENVEVRDEVIGGDEGGYNVWFGVKT